jgi:hypothetical protein
VSDPNWLPNDFGSDEGTWDIDYHMFGLCLASLYGFAMVLLAIYYIGGVRQDQAFFARYVFALIILQHVYMLPLELKPALAWSHL